jgi:hypothetical protein
LLIVRSKLYFVTYILQSTNIFSTHILDGPRCGKHIINGVGRYPHHGGEADADSYRLGPGRVLVGAVPDGLVLNDEEDED